MSARGYVSDELTHFVGRTLKSDDERFRLLVEIVRSGWLSHRPEHNQYHETQFKLYRRAPPSQNALYDDELAVCFCDIPFPGLGLHMSKYSSFGLAFLKPFLAAQGATPVFYVAMDSLIWKKRPEFAGSGTKHVAQPGPEHEKLVKDMARIDPTKSERKPRSEILDQEIATMFNIFSEREGLLRDPSLPDTVRAHLVRAQRQDIVWYTILFPLMKLFDSGKPDSDPEHYYLEREWRVLDNVEFSLADVARIIVPASYVERVRTELPDFTGPVTTVD